MTTATDSRTLVRCAQCAILLVLLARLAGMAWLPILGSTEGRYASSAIDIVERDIWVPHRATVHGDWPAYLAAEPGSQWREYVGKPPLAIWCSALAMQWFGASEFAARLPSLLIAILIVCLLWHIARVLHGETAAWLTALVAASSLYFTAAAGLIMLDMFAALPAAVVMAALVFRDRTSGWRRHAWGYAPFVALGLGMLIKGPVTVALAVGPAAVYILWSRRWGLLGGWPWLSGTLVALAVCVPWFRLMEARTPGFLYYFFYEEHVRRFLDPTFDDPFGKPHAQAPGAIWLHWLMAWSPWTLVVAGFPVRSWRSLREQLARRDALGWLFLFFATAPALLFTPSTSITPPYVVPGIAGVALLLGPLLERLIAQEAWARRGLLLFGVPFLAALAAATALQCVERGSASPLAWLSAACTVLFAAVVLVGWKRRDARAPIAAAVLAPLFGALLAFTVFAPRFAYMTGARDLIAAALERAEPGRNIVVVRRWELPFGYYAYGRADYIDEFVRPAMARHVEDERRDVYVFRSKYFGRPEEMPATIAAALTEEWSDGTYSVYTDRPLPPAAFERD